MLQHSARAMVVLLRTTGNTDDVVTRLRGEVSALDASLALFDVEMVTTALARAIAPTRIMSGMFIGFASAALLLAATGLYGVMSYTVSLRTHEFGTRIALGARAADIGRLVLLNGVRLVLAGVGLGLVAGLGLARTMKSVLYGVAVNDPTTLAAAVALLAAVACLASYGPTRRATRVDALTALRSE